MSDPLLPLHALAGNRRARVLAADIGGSFIKLAGAGEDAMPLARASLPNPAQFWPDFVETLRSLADAADPARRLTLALSVAGTIDPDTGASLAANISCITGRSLKGELTSALGRRVEAANDADCFALAEALRGAGRGHRTVFGVILGTGVGGGLIWNGHILEGAGGVSGEWGHGPVLKDRIVAGRIVPAFACGCGQVGCVDASGSARGMERIDAALHPAGPVRDSRAIVDAWRAGETEAALTIDTWLDTLAGPLSLVLNATGASVVPVGGGLSNAPDLLAALDARLRAGILRRTEAPVIKPAELGPEAGLVGAALLGLGVGKD
ncbi:ROK family protein [Aureimonas sp. AU20]|uniref:ROK family protein n=1 Tax=Aureimonas sp. AU20 TaxID=1349819 RepID=UPI0007207679|nr:ROK family protein [Aureimonas sp. AU20]ALN74431.1 hypothetical protein M673_17010 [Aureimonas sp. AU20]